jgi:WD40 repeat protein
VIVLDSQHVFVSARDGKVFVVDRQVTEVAGVLQQSSEGIWDMVTDSSHIYTASVDQLIRVWNKASWNVVGVFRGHRANIQALALDNTHLYSLATDKNLIVWERESGDPVVSLRRVYTKGMLGLLCTQDHLMALNTSQGLKIWKKGQWDAPESEHPSIRANKAVVDNQRAYFGLRDGSIAVFLRTELGI